MMIPVLFNFSPMYSNEGGPMEVLPSATPDFVDSLAVHSRQREKP